SAKIGRTGFRSVNGDTATRSRAAISDAWWATSSSVASSTARRVRTRPSPSVRPMQRTTISAIAWKRRVRRLLTPPAASSRRHELVPGAADGADRLGIAQLAPELGDVHVDGARAAGIRHPPHEVEQLLAREHDARVLEEAREQLELLARQLDRRAGDRHVARVAPQDDVAGGEHGVLAALLGAPEDRLDARRELARRERLRDVVVRPELEPGDPVGLLVAGGEHHDRHLRVRPHPAADLEAVDAGEADVEHDEAHRMPPQLGDRLLARPEPHDPPAVLLLEVRLDEPADRVVVLDEEQDAAGRRDRHA